MTYLNIDPTLCRGKFTNWAAFTPADDWVVEEKFNGDRRIAQFTKERTYFTGRRDGINSGNKRDVSECLPMLSRAMPDFAGLILDGELIVPGGNNSDTTEVVGGSALHALQVLQRPGHPGLIYKVFDILAEPGRDLTLYTWEQRRKKLEHWVERLVLAGIELGKERFQISYVQPASRGQALYEAILANGGEGVVLKWKRSKYTDQRYWVKVKPWDLTVVRCMGFKAGEGKFQGLIGSLHFVELETGMHGSCSGMTDAERAYMTEQQDSLIGRLFTLRYTSRLVSGAFQHPRFKGWVLTPGL